MKKHNIPPGIGLTLMFVLFAFLSFGKAMDPKTDTEIRKRVESLTASVDVKYNREVKSKIWNLIGDNPRVSEVVLGRSSIYFPLIESILREKNMPEDLKYLAVIESGLNPQAVSHANAVGLWQFMKPTARYVGLDINRAVDERRDPIKSTYAAVEYIQMLYDQFGDWTIALAAYNCGPGNMSKAIRRANGSKDFWVVQKYLPSETRNYIPKFIAMNYLMNYYYAHGIRPEEVDQQMKFTASVKVFDKILLTDVAKQYNLEFELIKKLNPAFLRNFIPKSEGKHYLTLPEEILLDFVHKNNAQKHLFQVGPTTMSNELQLAMEAPPVKEVVKVEEIKIRKTPSLGISEKGVQMRNPSKFSLVKLKRGQSLQDIADEFEVSVNDLIAANGYDESNLPVQGDVIMIFE